MSGMIFVLSGGGGLNLKAVSGTSAPTNPKENTVWVNTDIDIHSYAFSATQPHRVSKNKNLIVYPYFHTTQTLEGVTWTDNGDGTLTANGTASASTNSNFRCSHIGVNKHEMLLSPGTYHLSGCPAGGSSAKYVLEMAYSYDDWATTTWARDYGSGVTFTLTAEAKARLVCTVIKAATVSNIVFKPQLEKGSTATSFVKGDATGMVWFRTGTSSNAAINVDKKNTVMLYPIGCSQYISGAFVDKTAQVYLSSKWQNLLIHNIISNGVMLETLSTFGKKWDSSQSVAFNNMTVTQQSGYVSVKGSTTGFGAAYIQSDLTNVKEIVVDGTLHTGTHHKLVAWSNIDGTYMTSNIAASVDLTETGASLDVSSLSGSYYIGVTSEYNHEHKIVNFFTR